jgi:isocitrate dehydrogenase
MIWDNYIGTEFLVSESVCKNIIDFAEDKIEKGFFTRTQSKFRNDVSVGLSNMGSYKNSENFTIINKAIRYFLNEFLSNFTINQSEKNYSYIEHKFQKTVENGGFYTWHFESGGKQNNRAFVWMLYLNTVEKGGQT